MRKMLSFLALAAVTLFIMIAFASQLFSFTPQKPIIKMDKGWTVTFHEQQYLNTNLESMSHQVGSSFNKGDIVTLNHISPLRDIHAAFPYLFFKTQYSAFEVFLDDEIIASRYMDYIPTNKYVGIGYNFIPLPKNYDGKRLTIMLYVTENGTKVDLTSPVVGDYDDLYRWLFQGVLYPFFISMFLILFGSVFLAISLIFYMRSSGVTTQILCSFLTITLGFWALTGYDMSDFVLPPYTTTTVEYCFLYMIAPFMYMIILDLHRNSNNKLLWILGIATTMFSFLFIGLHFTNLVHINHFLFPYYLISLAGLALLVNYTIVDLKSKSRDFSKRILMSGLMGLTVSLILHALVIVLRRFIPFNDATLQNVMIPTGAMFFVFTQLLNYFIFMTHSFAQKKEYAALTKIAYIDNLTGLANRVSCDEKMLSFDNIEDDFCILSLDLNGLKEVNDNSGHPAGDRLLKSFAETLSSIFDETGFCARIGGDEFLVLIKSIDRNVLDNMLKELDARLLKLDEEDLEINHSVSYGYAFRHETEEHDTHSVSMLADKRMYEYKRKHYANMMGR